MPTIVGDRRNSGVALERMAQATRRRSADVNRDRFVDPTRCRSADRQTGGRQPEGGLLAEALARSVKSRRRSTDWCHGTAGRAATSETRPAGAFVPRGAARAARRDMHFTRPNTVR